MRARSRIVLSGLALVAALFGPMTAVAVVVERIVAVVGDQPILLSELRSRARPFLIQIQQKVRPGAEQAAAESQVFRDMLQKMIDEELEAQAAEKAGISVTAEEIDNAFRNIAASQGVKPADLFREVARSSGLSEQEYREEIKRQILEGKMLQLRVRGRVRITEEDLKDAYERAVREEKRRREYHPAWIVLQIMPGSSPEAIAERQKLADEIVTRARSGEDFAMLAKAYSDDTPTRDAGGDLGIRAPQGSQQAQQGREIMATEFEPAVLSLEPGQVTAPLRVQKGIVIIKLLSRQASRYTSYEAAKPELAQALQTEILMKAKRKWLDEMKKRTHLDVRL